MERYVLRKRRGEYFQVDPRPPTMTAHLAISVATRGKKDRNRYWDFREKEKGSTDKGISGLVMKAKRKKRAFVWGRGEDSGCWLSRTWGPSRGGNDKEVWGARKGRKGEK